MAPMMVNMAWPMGVAVSSCSWREMNPTLRVRNVSRAATKVLDRSREAIEAPDEDDLELGGPGRLHQPVECPPALLGAETPRSTNSRPPASPAGRVTAEGDELDLGVLTLGGHTGVERTSRLLTPGGVSPLHPKRQAHTKSGRGF